MQTKEEATVYVKELDFFVTIKLLEDTPAVLSLGKLCEDHGKKYHWTRDSEWYVVRRVTFYLSAIFDESWFLTTGLSTSSSSSSSPTSPTSSSQEAVTPTQHPASIRSKSMSDEVRGDSSRGPTETENPSKNDNEEVRGDPLRDLPEWLEEFTENLVDDSVPEHRDASSSSHELLSEPRAKVVSGKHSIFTHFPKDRHCDICLRTKITRAPCRRRTGPVVPRAEKLVL